MASKTFQVTRVESDGVGGTFPIPGMIVTVAELRAMTQCGPHTVNVYCETCGESVADCPKTCKLAAYPHGWSAFDSSDE